MLIKVKVYPKSRKQELIVKNKDTLIVYLKEKAENNEANSALMFLLAEHFNVSVSKIRIIKGSRTPNKIINIYEN